MKFFYPARRTRALCRNVAGPSTSRDRPGNPIPVARLRSAGSAR